MFRVHRTAKVGSACCCYLFCVERVCMHRNSYLRAACIVVVYCNRFLGHRVAHGVLACPWAVIWRLNMHTVAYEYKYCTHFAALSHQGCCPRVPAPSQHSMCYLITCEGTNVVVCDHKHSCQSRAKHLATLDETCNPNLVHMHVCQQKNLPGWTAGRQHRLSASMHS